MKQNEQQGIEYKDPTSDDERAKIAGDCAKGLKLTIPMLIDDMTNTAQKAYAGWPDRFYVIGKDGKVAFRGELGPKGFKPADAEAALKKVLEK